MIAEIVGLAGAGKSTIAQNLSQRNPAIRCSFSLRPIQFIPAFLGRAILSLPGYLWRYRSGKQASWEALMVMVYLERLYRILSRYGSDDSTVFLLDQGPVFLLTYLHDFGFQGVRDQKLEAWWMRMLDSWAPILNVIFWIDAPDAVLLERIHHRGGTWHRVEDMSEQETHEFFARYRRTYRQVISRLTSDGSPKVLRFSTDEEPLDQVVNEIMDTLEPGWSECQT